MRILLQRVSEARVEAEGRIVGEIGRGFLALVGVGQGDTEDDAAYLAEKTCNLRVFQDAEGKMNRSLLDVSGAVLSVSQFTLFADARRGRRPSFTAAGAPDVAKRLYEFWNARVAGFGVLVQTGIFAAEMRVSLTNEGPVTILLDTKEMRS